MMVTHWGEWAEQISKSGLALSRWVSGCGPLIILLCHANWPLYYYCHAASSRFVISGMSLDPSRDLGECFVMLRRRWQRIAIIRRF